MRIMIAYLKTVAKELRQIAELAAKPPQNWDNFEAIVISVLEQVQEATREATWSNKDER